MRREAEDRLVQGESRDVGKTSDADVRALLHELQVHQIELEMQNDELMQAKAEAEDALRKYSDLYDFAPVGYVTINVGGIILEANLTASTMLGVPRSKLIGSLFRLWVAPKSKSDVLALCSAVIDSGENVSRELTLLKGKTEPFFALIIAMAAKDHASRSQCRIAITDITRRKKAEDALYKAYAELEEKVEERTAELAEARLEAERRAAEIESFVASMADGVVLFNARGEITFINDTGMGILGAPLGASFERLMERTRFYDLKGDIIPPEEEAAGRALLGESVTDMRGTLALPWGKSVTLSMSTSPVLSGEGEVIGATMVFRDQSERIRFENERQALLEREQHIADILEQAVIPEAPRHVAGLEVAVRYEPAHAEAVVGGDFYDVFELSGGKVGVLIGDVAGKGLAAAVGIAAIRYSIRSYAYLDARPSKVLTLANDALCKGEPGWDELNMFTAFFAVIDTRSGEISYANGGHEPGMLKTADGNVERLEAPGTLVGIFPGIQYSEIKRKLLPGDVVAVVTDGITESRRDPESLFGIEGVERYLESSSEESPDALAEGILRSAKDHAGGHFADDAAIVVVSLGNGR